MPIRVTPPHLSARIGANVKSLDVSGPIGGGVNLSNRGVIIRKPANPLITIQNQINQQIQQQIPADIHFEQLQRDGFTPRTSSTKNITPVGGALLGAAVGTAIGGITKQKEGLLPGALLGAGLGSSATQLQDRDLDKLNRDGFTNRLSTTGGVLTGGVLGAGLGALAGGDDKKNMIIGGVAGAAFGGLVASIAEQNALNQQVNRNGFLKNGVSDFLGKNGVLGTGIEPGRDPREGVLNSKGFTGNEEKLLPPNNGNYKLTYDKKETLHSKGNFGKEVSTYYKKDYARPVDYEVMIGGKVVELIGGSSLSRQISFHAAVASIPGETITTFDYGHHGIAEKRPIKPQYGDYSITFYVDSKMTEIKFFRKWMDLIVDRKTNKVAYIDSIVGQIDIQQLDRQGNLIYQDKLGRAYPTQLGDLFLDYSTTNAIHKVQVVFTYYEAMFDEKTEVIAKQAVPKTTEDFNVDKQKSGLQILKEKPGARFGFAGG